MISLMTSKSKRIIPLFFIGSGFVVLVCSGYAFGRLEESLPEFQGPVNNASVPLGRDAVLECTVKNLGKYQVAWLRADSDGGTLLSVHTNIIVKDSRLRVTQNNHRQWILNIRDIKSADRGIYMCQINTEPMISQTGFLDVLVPPTLSEDETSTDRSVEERNKVSLRCKASGYPTPNITWRREDGKELNLGFLGGKRQAALKADGEYFNITQVTREDMGAYLCIASNGVPPSVSKRISLQVNFRPKIRVPQQLVGASKGTQVLLECRVEASPKPLTSWIRHDQAILLPTNKYQIAEEIDSYRIRMVLKITNLEDKDFGAYKCVAKNTAGEKEGYIRVYESSHLSTQTVPVYLTSSSSSSSSSSSFIFRSSKNIFRDNADKKSSSGKSNMNDAFQDLVPTLPRNHNGSVTFGPCQLCLWFIFLTISSTLQVST